jgi:hypothetical protein
MQRNDAGEAAGSGRDAALKDRNVLFAGLPGKTGRTEASGQDPRRGLADLNKAGKGDQEEVRDRRRERIARSPGAGNRFEIRDFRGDAEIKSPLGKSGDFGFSGPGEVPETELVVRLEGRSQPESRNSGESPLRETLSQELRGALGQDIVRHASMILKDGGEGLIRLSLKPESLGNVKIRLELSENKIAGRIIVENSDALRAFERELPVLEAAFRDSGFDGASLELAQDGARGEGGQRNREEARPFYSESLASSSYDALLEYRAENSGAFIRGETRVNMLA